MQAAMELEKTFRGVSCRHCSRPIRLPASIVRREISFNQNRVDAAQQWRSRVFSHRCRTCGGEAIYALNHIFDFEDKTFAPK